MSRASLSALVLVLFWSALPGARQSQSPPVPGPTLDVLLERAGAYVLKFETLFSNVVSEEEYEQRVVQTAGGSMFAQARMAAGRRLRSDFTLIRSPDGSVWLPFRDVFEVDGRPVRDREDRLSKLFLTPTTTALVRAREIMQEGSRYNIGDVSRTINVPVVAFVVARPEFQSRFQFTKGKVEKSVGSEATIIAFRERAHPSFIRGPNDTDMPSAGRLWIDAPTGQILKAELTIDTPIVRAMITTRFSFDPSFDLAIPVEMNEEYTQGRKPVVVGTAKYSRFRRFGVSATGEVK